MRSKDLIKQVDISMYKAGDIRKVFYSLYITLKKLHYETFI